MKCPTCHFDMEWRGAFETVDGVKYRSYGCKQCHSIVRGEKVEEVG